MKKILIALLFITHINAGDWSSATVFSFGTRENNTTDPNVDVKLEQYFVHPNHPKIHYKVGFFHEDIAHLEYSDGAIIDQNTADNLTLGIGYNLIELWGLYIDAGVTLGMRLNVNEQLGSFFHPVDLIDYRYHAQFEPYTTFFELNMGYTFGNWTLLLNSTVSFSTAKVTRSDPFAPELYETQSIGYQELHMALGIGYWW